MISILFVGLFHWNVDRDSSPRQKAIPVLFWVFSQGPLVLCVTLPTNPCPHTCVSHTRFVVQLTACGVLQELANAMTATYEPGTSTTSSKDNVQRLATAREQLLEACTQLRDHLVRQCSITNNSSSSSAWGRYSIGAAAPAHGTCQASCLRLSSAMLIPLKLVKDPSHRILLVPL